MEGDLTTSPQQRFDLTRTEVPGMDCCQPSNNNYTQLQKECQV